MTDTPETREPGSASLIDYLISAAHQLVDGRAAPDRSCFYYECRLCCGNDRGRPNLTIRPTISGVVHQPDCLLSLYKENLKSLSSPQPTFADGVNWAIEALRKRRNEWDFPKTPWSFRDEMMGCGRAADYLAANRPAARQPTALERELAEALDAVYRRPNPEDGKPSEIHVRIEDVLARARAAGALR